MKFWESGAAFAQDMGVPVSKMEESIEAHQQGSLKPAEDPDGVPYPAHPSEKSWKIQQDGFREEVQPQRHFGSRFCHTTFLCGSYHSRNPLLHQWIGN